MRTTEAPYTNRMYDAESEYPIYAHVPESLYIEFKVELVKTKIRQKKAVKEAIKLWLDNQDTIKSNCLICGVPIEYTGFLVYGDHTFESAVLALKQNMVCDNPECTIGFEKIHNPDNYNTLFELHKKDKFDFCDAIQKSWEQTQ